MPAVPGTEICPSAVLMAAVPAAGEVLSQQNDISHCPAQWSVVPGGRNILKPCYNLLSERIRSHRVAVLSLAGLQLIVHVRNRVYKNLGSCAL